VLGLLAVCSIAAPAMAAEDEVPMEITADSMRFEQDKRVIVFTGNVHAQREDIDIRALTVTVHLKETPGQVQAGTTGGEIDKIVAEGDVRINQGERIGKSKLATYYADQGLLVMEGDPVLEEGKNRIQGKIVRLYLRENRSEIEGGGGKRVEALIFTPKQMDEQE
jgi:lipopolysaccharide export system protein LptA